MTTTNLQMALEMLDLLYTKLRGMYERGDFSIEDVVRIQVDTMKLIGELVVHLNGGSR